MSNADLMEGYNATYSKEDPSMNVSVHSQRNLAQLSPYLNFNSVYLPPSQPEFIFPNTSRPRGRSDLAFSHIGGSCMVGATIGGITGFYKGLRDTTLAGETGKLQRTQIINHVMKHGSATANTLGVVAVMYSAFGIALSKARDCDDELNTLVSATATGLLYKSSAGLKKCAIGGAVGFSLAAAFCLWNARDKLHGFRQEYNPANGAVIVQSPSEPSWAADRGCTCWGLLAGLSAITIILLLSHAVIMTDGYYKTCNQYRRTLVKSLVATGNTVKVIYNRLSCGPIYDFMDYMEPVTRPFRIKDESRHRPYDEERDFQRGSFINTGLALIMAITCSWINFILWFTALVCYSILSCCKRCCLC